MVDLHIDRGCPKKVAKKGCAAKGCTAKPVVPIVCAKCGGQFCVKHRMDLDHACAGRGIRLVSVPASRPAGPVKTNVQPTKQQNGRTGDRERERQLLEDAQLAEALQRSLNEEASGAQPGSRAGARAGSREEKSSCSIS